MEKNSLKNSWAMGFTVASVWFGTHVGGGFASGNQVVGYFSKFGAAAALIYPLLAMGILACIMHIMLKFARLNGFNNYKDTYRALYPQPWMEVFFEVFYIIIILAAVAAAVAGAGNVLANFLGIEYVGATKVIMNLIIVAILVVLSIFGVKVVAAASTVLSILIMISTAAVVIAGLVAAKDGDAVRLLQQYSVEGAPYASQFAGGFFSSAPFRAILVYAGFQCVSIPPMIAASEEMGTTGTKRACILGWLMNGLALSLSGYMLSKWYPLLQGLQNAGIEGFKTATSIPNQTVLTIIGLKWLLAFFSILLFCAFVSTCVTLIFTMVQRFQGKFFPKAIQSEQIRKICVAVIAIAVCFSISLLGLTTITTKLYGYDGYYALIFVVLPALIWGIPKIKKLEAEGKTAE
ncbi:MAG: hypothetical protein IJ594_01330 [Oscillospiraceae bacterium]|nr:hypothetical protein [Oscillospiraceae bacterium]